MPRATMAGGARRGDRADGEVWSEMQSRLKFDYRNAMDVAVGADNGVSEAMLDAIAPKVRAEHERLQAEHAAGGQKWMNLPDDHALADEIGAFADAERDRYTDFVLIGIGGSSLGAIATVMALAHPFRNLQSNSRRIGPRLFVLDNPDPEKVQATLETLDLGSTMVNVVTKSGQTAETMANFLVMKHALEKAVGKEKAAKQIVATTDPKEGLLRQMADAEGYRTFPVPPGVDGRPPLVAPAAGGALRPDGGGVYRQRAGRCAALGRAAGVQCRRVRLPWPVYPQRPRARVPQRDQPRAPGGDRTP